jgi:hypothetical protein
LKVPDGRRFSDLERWRRGPAKPSGRNLERAIARVAEIKALGLSGVGVDGVVAQRRLVELARYGMAANARTLRRHPRSRRLATLLATVVALEAKATDDCLELLDLLMVTELLGKAERESVKEKARQHPRLARASAKLATAVEVLLDATSAEGAKLGQDEVWELIDAVVSRGELRGGRGDRRARAARHGRRWRQAGAARDTDRDRDRVFEDADRGDRVRFKHRRPSGPGRDAAHARAAAQPQADER